MEGFGQDRGLVDLMEKEREEKLEKQMQAALKKMPWQIKKIEILLKLWKWIKRG